MRTCAPLCTNSQGKQNLVYYFCGNSHDEVLYKLGMDRELPRQAVRAAALIVGHHFGDREPRVVVQLLDGRRYVGATFKVAKALELADRIASLARELEGGGGQNAGMESPQAAVDRSVEWEPTSGSATEQV